MEFHLIICLINRQLCFPYIAVPLVLRVSDIHDFGDQGTSNEETPWDRRTLNGLL